jgi:protein disulfide-isomerase A6
VWEKNCAKAGSQKVCVIAFLPHIYDSTAAERNAHIDLLAQTAKKHRNQPFAWFWAQAGDHLDLQKQFDVGFGFPQVVTFAPTKKMGSVMLSTFGAQNLGSFLTSLMAGKERVFKIEQELAVKKVDKWDGKDQQPPLYLDEL